jgi:hypothetical protein
VAFISYHARIGIRVNEARALQRIVDLLPAGSVPSPTPVVPDLFSVIVAPAAPDRGSGPLTSHLKRFNLLYLGAALIVRTLDEEELFQSLEEHVQRLVALQSPRRLFIRGHVLRRHDRATLVASDPNDAAVIDALLRDGASEFSTSYAVLDARGNANWYSSDRPGFALSARPVLRPSDGPVFLPVDTVLFPRLTTNTTVPLRELTRAQASLRLLQHTVVGRMRPRFALAMLARSLRRAVAFEVAVGPVSAGPLEGGPHVSTCATSSFDRGGVRS